MLKLIQHDNDEGDLMIDTHTHLNFEVFKDNWREVVKEAVRAGANKMIVVGTDLESSKRAVEMAQEHEALFAAVGIHPHHARQYINSASLDSSSSIHNDKLINEILKQVQDDVDILHDLTKKPKMVAVGEVGLDRHVYINSKYEIRNTKQEQERLIQIQKELFVRQVELAVELNKPLILHSREAGDEVLEILKRVQGDSGLRRGRIRGVFHCYDGSKKYLKKILDAGFYISFTGNVTYSHDRLEVAKMVPLDKLLLETDSPYMLPEPMRSISSTSPSPSLVRRGKIEKLVNTPGNVKIVASYHAENRGITEKEVVEQTTINARQLFGI